MELKYRSDIDGLRAVAVLAVLFFHVDLPFFSGGFVGVDVFFVISGFLITNIILKDIQQGGFSVARFYERRIRRIFPALFPVIAFVLLIGYLIYYPSAFKDLGMSVNTTVLFSSNIFFWMQTGYFDAPVMLKPLLHTWSLAVEEQFYIFFPLVLVLISRFLKSNYFPWLTGLFVFSLAISIFGVSYQPTAAYYLMPTRAWELIAGSLIALRVLPVISSSFVKNIMSFTGLMMIAYSIVFYDSSTPFPGVAALLPVLGSGLVIYSGIDDGNYAMYRFLSIRPLVFIGLISYSLYLWHWPLVAFSKYLLFNQGFNGVLSVSIIVLSVVFAVLSWKYIEAPFRGKNPVFPDRKWLFFYSGLVMLMMTGIGVFVYASDGLYGFIKTAKMFGLRKNIYVSKSFDKPLLIGDASTSPSFVLWGDSHAMALAPAINYMAKKYKLSGYVFAHGNTLPILGCDLVDGGFDEGKYNEDVLSFILKNKIENVFISGCWSSYITNKGDMLIDGKREKGSDHRFLSIMSAFKRSVLYLKGKGLYVYFICDVPHWNVSPVRFFYLKERFPDVEYIDSCLGKVDYIGFFKKYNAVFNDQVMLSYGEVLGRDYVLMPDRVIASEDILRQIIRNGKLLYDDSNHLSYDGAIYVSAIFERPFLHITQKKLTAIRK